MSADRQREKDLTRAHLGLPTLLPGADWDDFLEELRATMHYGDPRMPRITFDDLHYDRWWGYMGEKHPESPGYRRKFLPDHERLRPSRRATVLP